MAEIRISEREKKCLIALYHQLEYSDKGNCAYARAVAKTTGLEVNEARNALRSLMRKGLVEYHRGLFNDDGFVAGSGWRCSPAGLDRVPAEEKDEEESNIE